MQIKVLSYSIYYIGGRKKQQHNLHKLLEYSANKSENFSLNKCFAKKKKKQQKKTYYLNEEKLVEDNI